ARLPPAHLVIIRSTEGKLVDQRPARRWNERPRRRILAPQAGATQRVELPFRSDRMEVHVDDIPRVAVAFIVPGMLLLAADAGISQYRSAIHLAEWRTQLAAMRNLVNRQSVDH